MYLPLSWKMFSIEFIFYFLCLSCYTTYPCKVFSNKFPHCFPQWWPRARQMVLPEGMISQQHVFILLTTPSQAFISISSLIIPPVLLFLKYVKQMFVNATSCNQRGYAFSAFNQDTCISWTQTLQSIHFQKTLETTISLGFSLVLLNS